MNHVLLIIISIFALFIPFEIGAVEYIGCEKEFKWIGKKQLGSGTYGAIYEACRGTNCDFVAKVIRGSISPWETESNVLERLKGTAIVPEIYESFTCMYGIHPVGVIIMEKYDGTLEKVLTQYFDKFVIQKFGSQEKALDYFIDGIIEKLGDKTNREFLIDANKNSSFAMWNKSMRRLNREKHIIFDPLPEELVSMLGQVRTALSTLSNLGVINRDMKPDNIMHKSVNGATKVVLIDFGSAVDKYDKDEDKNPFKGSLTYWANFYADRLLKPVKEVDYQCYDATRLEFYLFTHFGIQFQLAPEACVDYPKL